MSNFPWTERERKLFGYNGNIINPIEGLNKMFAGYQLYSKIWFRDLRFRIWDLEIKHLKAHNFVWQGCFFFHYYLATSKTVWAQIFTGLLFYAYVETHQLWRLVFDNYQ